MRRHDTYIAWTLLPLLLVAVVAMAALAATIVMLRPPASSWAGAVVVLVSVVALAYWAVRTLERLGSFLSAAAREREATQRTLEGWVAGIGHDLKTPLSAIRGYAELLASGEWPAEEVRRQASVVVERCAGMERLIEELQAPLEGGGVAVAEVTPVDTAAVLREVIEEQRSDPRTGSARLCLADEPGDSVAMADRELLRRAIVNVLVNAVTHNPMGTKVTASVAVEGGRVYVTVADEGKGIDPRVIETIFRASADEAVPVTGPNGRGDRDASDPAPLGDDGRRQEAGLGMTIARQLVEAQGGEFVVETSARTGSLVRMSLPRAEHSAGESTGLASTTATVFHR